MTIEEAYNHFLIHGRAERGYATETLAKMRECFVSWIQPTFRELPVEQLTRVHVLTLRNAMLDRKLSQNRQYNVLMVLRLFLKFCRTILKLEVLSPAEVPLPPRPTPRVQFLTNDEVQKLLAAASVSTFTGLRLRVLIEILIATGLRISEALALDRKPIEAGVRQLEIIGKGGKPRIVFFNDRAILWARKLLSVRNDSCQALFTTSSEPPRRWERNDVSRYFIELRQRAGIDKPVTPHLLRHTFCTNLLHNGADVTFIRDLAGHADIRTTAKYYLGVDPKRLQRVVDEHLDYGFQEAA
jgi:integrase/recombinase XerD